MEINSSSCKSAYLLFPDWGAFAGSKFLWMTVFFDFLWIYELYYDINFYVPHAKPGFFSLPPPNFLQFVQGIL